MQMDHTVELEAGSSHTEFSPSSYDATERDDDGRPKRTGTLWTASAHIVTAVIGSGVLSLAWSMAKLGWIAGPLTLLAFAFITYFNSLLLADCYRSPTHTSPILQLYNGSPVAKRNYTYMDAVRSNLGGIHTKFCAVVQYANFIGIAIGYTITSSISMVAIAKSDCFHSHGHQTLACGTSNNLYMMLFGVTQVVLSQIPSFSKLSWLSIVAAIMSFSYSTVALGLGIAKVIENGQSHGTLGGLLVKGDDKNIWSIFQALGNIAFAFSFSMLLIEIQDTIKSPNEGKTMKKANLIGVSTTTFFYMMCGCVGYASFGENAPGNLLTDFGFYEPYWLLNFANACVVVHLIGAYQVFCQPLFAFVESKVGERFPKSHMVHWSFQIKLTKSCGFELHVFRFLWRTTFVVSITLISMLLPFFNDILGILGALGFWPLTVFLPIQMYLKRSYKTVTKMQRFLLQALSAFCLLVSIAAFIGSIQGLRHHLSSYTPFKTVPT